MNKIHLLFIFILSLIFIFASIYLYHHAPGEDSYLPKCPFYQITRFHCPGCGITRAYYSFLHGDYLMAVRHNPIAIPILILATAFLFFPRLATHNYILIPILITIIAFWILRNLPWHPFTLLSPLPI
ncbi:MAG: DUF2752 domain-containing protein [Planctomycetia bacterium]|nr:DUF2752 domain-containing protein [Planctomycetia bacterium]